MLAIGSAGLLAAAWLAYSTLFAPAAKVFTIPGVTSPANNQREAMPAPGSTPTIRSARLPAAEPAEEQPEEDLPANLPTLNRKAVLQKPALADPWSAALPQFITAMAADTRGNLWLATEETGVWCYNPQTKQARKYGTKDGLGDDSAYAIAVDLKGRIWVGHQNHGVSVYAGGENGAWRNYEVVAGLSRPESLAGPLGERVFDIAVNPSNGDIWIATNAGLARYSDDGRWRYYTRAEGLSSDQVQCLAFSADGMLFAGTQCDGILMSTQEDDYTSWRATPGPTKMPLSPVGEGLPTNLINDILITKQGTVFAATTLGLARSDDQGQTWQYWRGKDYADKVKGLYGGPPASWQADVDSAILAEDYITCLSTDDQGKLWIGYRQKGYEVLDPETSTIVKAGLGRKNEGVT